MFTYQVDFYGWYSQKLKEFTRSPYLTLIEYLYAEVLKQARTTKIRKKKIFYIYMLMKDIRDARLKINVS